MTTVTIRYFAAAQAARGTDAERLDPQALGISTLGGLVEHLSREPSAPGTDGLDLATVLTRCTFLLDGRKAGPEAALDGVGGIDVLPPFAGG